MSLLSVKIAAQNENAKFAYELRCLRPPSWIIHGQEYFSPPQMPVPLKHMYNANILRAEFTIFFPNYPLYDTP